MPFGLIHLNLIVLFSFLSIIILVGTPGSEIFFVLIVIDYD